VFLSDNEQMNSRRYQMDHGPATEWKTEKSEGYKTRLGLIMFAIYVPIYFLFVFICVLSPKTMAMDIGSLNLAIVYGFFLIILAIIQALIYNRLCSRKEEEEKRLAQAKGEVAK
jgi:uncharacterized membrane protein (DUF485 family)